MPRRYMNGDHWQNRGDIDAQFNLGVLYSKGHGVTQDYTKAAEWFQKAAAQGHDCAPGVLGLMYLEGEGVPQDYTEAVNQLRKSAALGVAESQFNLGALYSEGKGVTQNYAEAVKWYRKAAEQLYDQAQYNLGIMYGKGRGVPQNVVLAYMWFYLAGLQFLEIADKNRDAIAGLMTPDQIKEAEKLAHKWLVTDSRDTGLLEFRTPWLIKALYVLMIVTCLAAAIWFFNWIS